MSPQFNSNSSVDGSISTDSELLELFLNTKGINHHFSIISCISLALGIGVSCGFPTVNLAIVS